MSRRAIARVRAFEARSLEREQVPITTHHLIHAGMYARTITIPAGVALTGALIRLATTLIVSGDVIVTIGEHVRRLTGYHVLPASAGRKQAFLALADTHMTMLFPTASKDVAGIEDEFTEEAGLLFSRQRENVVNITGES